MIVSHLFPDGTVETYGAVLRFPGEGSTWSTLETNRQKYFAKIGPARAFFLSAVDWPIPDWPDWFAISDFPVELSQHTAGKTCMTKVVMDGMG
jgi:hypothetical protein